MANKLGELRLDSATAFPRQGSCLRKSLSIHSYQVPRMKSVQFCFLFCCWRAICCRSCELTNITITVEKEECSFCISINTTWCAGYCYTRDLVYKDPARPNIQKACTFKELVYETVKVPGCAHHADSLYTYPVATECHCGKCDRDSTDCTVRGLGPSYCSFSDIRE
ncbi:hypothetical protein R6Z07F_014309 [Ovis aries]